MHRAGTEQASEFFERAIAADVGLDEVAREALRLCLRADENCDTENDAAQTQKQCPLAMR